MISTTIHNDIRSELGISTDEYLIAAAIDFFAYSPYNDDPWAFKKGKDVAELFGFSERTVTRALSTLAPMGLIEKSGKHKVRTTKLWREIHSLKNSANGARSVLGSGSDENVVDQPQKNEDVEEKWELFWSAYRPINNKDKANSRKAFGKVVGYFDAIMAAIPKYRDELDRDTWKQPKMASSWLNAMRWYDYESDETPEKNSANGAAENLSPFDVMAGRLSVIAKELFNSHGVDGVNAAELSAYAFDEKEKAFIESAGGFVVVLRNALGGDFKAMYRPVWEGMDV
ncbi:MAG: hypothetical protein AB1763_09230 [Campylobacterota bacterium]